MVDLISAVRSKVSELPAAIEGVGEEENGIQRPQEIEVQTTAE